MRRPCYPLTDTTVRGLKKVAAAACLVVPRNAKKFELVSIIARAYRTSGGGCWGELNDPTGRLRESAYACYYAEHVNYLPV